MSSVQDRRKGAIQTRHRPSVPGAPFIPDLEKAAAGGVATLGETTALVPDSQLATGVAAAGKALLGDRTWGDIATQAELDAEAATRAADDATLSAAITAGDALALKKASNLSDVANVATSRTNLGLGTAATKDVPAAGDAAAGEVVKGNDSRLTNSRAPNGAATGDLTGNYPNPTVANLAITDAKVAAANKDGAAATASMRTLGAGAAQACAGNDARLSDARTPTAHKTSHYPGGTDKLAVTEGSQNLVNTGTVDITVPSKQVIELFITADVDKAAYRVYIGAHNGGAGGNLSSIVDTTAGGFTAAWVAAGTIRITNLTGATSVFYWSAYERSQAIP